MLKNRTIPSGGNMDPFVDVIQTDGNIDYVNGGAIVKNAASVSVMVTAEADLSLLDTYEPGTLAYTAGFKKMWQKAADESWEEII